MAKINITKATKGRMSHTEREELEAKKGKITLLGEFIEND